MMRNWKGFIGVLGVLLLVFCTPAAAIELVSIDGNDVNMRSGPGTKYKVMWELGNGFPLIVLKRSGQWLRVRDFEGTIGWIHKNVAQRTPHMIVKVHKNSKKRINIRSGPGTKYRIVAKAYYGVVFKTLQQKNGWVNIQHEKGVNGWVKRSLLWGW
ncbi:MAG: SH3 domain-containing protein [Desulfobulbaceae bacterium]|nr:SH3 domain-containing protein [Desulfobulbaceae bacterium]